MIYDRAFFDNPVDRNGTRAAKWDARHFCQPGDLPLWVADWDFRCAEPIVEAIQNVHSIRSSAIPASIRTIPALSVLTGNAVTGWISFPKRPACFHAS